MGSINNMCRLCAQESRRTTLVSIFGSTSLENNLPDKINCHLPIKVSKDDGYPQAVCQTCVKKLDICHELIISCMEAHNKIQQLIDNDDDAKINVEWVSSDDGGQVKFAEEAQESPALNPEFEPECDSLDITESFGETPKKSAKRSDDTDSASEVDDGPGGANDDFTEDPEDTENVSDCQKQDHTEQSFDPSIAVVLLGYNPAKEHKEFDGTSELFLVSLAHADYASHEERLEAATHIVNKEKLTLAAAQAKSGGTKIICSSCSLAFQCPSNLNPSRKTQNVHCERCGHLNKQKSDVLLNPIDILKELLYHIYCSVKTFQKNLSRCVVTMLGKYSEESKAFVITNHPSKNAKSTNKCLSYEEENSICYLCGICNRNLPFSKEYFTKHLITEHFGVDNASKKLALTCTICSNTFKQTSTLNKHLKLIHGNKTKMKKAMCDECGKLVLSRTMATHKKTHLRLECQYCHEIVAYRTWTRHKQFQENPDKAQLKVSCVVNPRKHQPKFSVLACEYCNVVLRRKHWIYHNAIRALLGPNTKCPQNIPMLEEEQLSDEDQAKFQQHLKRASYFWNVRKDNGNCGPHYAYRLKSECPVCHKMLSQYQFKNHVNKHYGTLPFQCAMCNKSFASRNILAKHLKHVHLKIGLNCQYCKKFFAKKSQLECHEALHRGERNFKCPLCPKYFSGPPLVHNHVVQVHEGRYKGKKRIRKGGNKNVLN